jgi:hypothetical protein
METISAENFRQMGEEAAELLNSGAKLDTDVKNDLTLTKQRAENNERVINTIGINFNVITKHENANVGGCANISQNTAFIALGILDDKKKARHIGRHEWVHLKSGITELDIDKNLSPDHVSCLKDALKGLDIKADLVEGFTEQITTEMEGKMESCGYNQKEVPLAQKLEALCKKETGYSLKETFLSGNQMLFSYRLRKMADHLLCKKAVSIYAQKQKGLSSSKLINNTKDRLKKEMPPVSSLVDAERIVKKMYDEELQKQQIRSALAA